MPYTNPWDSNSPLGSQAANTADDEFRKFRLDMEERMEDKIITDITVDPWVLRPEVLGNVIGKRLDISFAAFAMFDTNDSVTSRAILNDGFFTAFASCTAVAPLILPAGATLTSLIFIVNPGGSSLNCTLRYGANPSTSVGFVSSSSGSLVSLEVLSGPHTIVANRAYYMRVVMPAAAQLQRVIATYDVADCRITL